MENDDIFTWKGAPQRGKGGYVAGVRDNRNFQPKGVPGPWGRKKTHYTPDYSYTSVTYIILYHFIYYVSLLCLPTLYH